MLKTVYRTASVLLAALLMLLSFHPAFANLQPASNALPAPRLLKEIGVDFLDPDIGFLTGSGNLVYFLADDDIHGRQLWVSDGSEVGTQLVKDLDSGTGFSDSDFYRQSLGSHGLLFTFYDGAHDNLYYTDGTESGTIVLAAQVYAHDFTPFGTSILFVQSSSNTLTLWKTDGTPGGTVPLKSLGNGNVQWTANQGGRVFLLVQDDSASTAGLWCSDGTSGGTQILTQTSSLGVSPAAVLNGRLYFIVNTGPLQPAYLWQSDGTPGGTTVVKNLLSQGMAYAIMSLKAANGLLFFPVNHGGSVRLWQSDGTDSGTLAVDDTGPTLPYWLTLSRDTLFFKSGAALYKTQGKAAGGVVKVADTPLNAATDDSLYTARGLLFYIASDGAGNDVWWSTNGTAPTALLGSAVYTAPTGLVELSGRLFFAASGVGGAELWSSAGSSASTARYADLNPGVNSSDPQQIGVFGGRLYFTADDGTHGRELWVVDDPLPEKTYIPIVQGF